MAWSREERRGYDKEYKTKNKERLATRQKEYWTKNKERIAAQQKEYKTKNKERIATRQKEYWTKNKERLATLQKEYWTKNKERLAAKKREYYKKKRDHILMYRKAYREKNKEAIREYRERRKLKNIKKEFWKTVPFVYKQPRTIAPFIPLKHGYTRNEPIMLYFIKITRLSGEIFFKIGVTRYSLKRRYSKLKDGYYTRLSSAALPAYLALALEAAFINKYSQHKYVPKDFDGFTECFLVNLKKEFDIIVPEEYKEV